METRNLEELVSLYRDFKMPPHISVGVRPSGTIHLGNMVTLSLPFIIAEELKEKKPFVTLTVCDLDMPSPSDWNVSKEGYVRFFEQLPDKRGCHPSLLEHSMEGIRDLMDNLSKQTGINYFERTFKTMFRDEEFRKGLKKAIDSPEVVKMLFPNLPESWSLVYPLCPSCHTAYSGTKKGKPILYNSTNGIINSWCFNPSCRVESYATDILDTDQDIAPHLLLTAIRDSTVSPLVDIHVYGGDYSEAHCTNGIPKTEKIRRALEIAAPGGIVPDTFVGPTILSNDGRKMGKTQKNGLRYESVREMFGSQKYSARVYELAKGALESGGERVNYEDLLG